MKNNEKEYYIDVDSAIKEHNKLNPNDILNRSILAKELGITYQSMLNYQFGRIPNIIETLDKISNRTGVPIDNLIKTK